MDNRIGWLDSTNAPSHIHKTKDGGETTVCGYDCGEMSRIGRWKINPEIPRKIHGSSRYCRTCFKDGGKTLPFIV